MIMTLTRTPAGNVTVPKIAKITNEEAALVGGGGTLVRFMQLGDLFAREPIEGDPSWKILDQLVKDGTISTITFAADTNDLNAVDEANEV